MPTCQSCDPRLLNKRVHSTLECLREQFIHLHRQHIHYISPLLEDRLDDPHRPLGVPNKHRNRPAILPNPIARPTTHDHENILSTDIPLGIMNVVMRKKGNILCKRACQPFGTYPRGGSARGNERTGEHNHLSLELEGDAVGIRLTVCTCYFVRFFAEGSQEIVDA